MTEQFAQLGLSLITPSLTNPRKNFNPERLQDLADSIKSSGVHTPILVRFLPGARVADTDRGVIYELVAGERRYRASEMAGMETIPAMIRALTDDQVLEIQLIENLQRDDLTELEEADGYEILMQHASITADQVGSKIGKSRSYVYARLKLLDLNFECKEAMRSGQIDVSRALLLARIPDGKLQLKALEFASTQTSRNEVPSVRELQVWLKSNVMLKLEHASFKITDTRLVESAGSCKDCPKRTGANPDLFSDVDGADICTDPECFHSKESAHRDRLIKKAEAKGIKLVEGKEAKEICSPWQSIPEGFSTVSQVRDDLAAPGHEAQTLRDVLGSDMPPTILFEHPRSKELMELVRTSDADAKLLAKGLISKVAKPGESEEEVQYELDHLKAMAEGAIKRATHISTFEAAVMAVRTCPGMDASDILPAEFLRAWLISEIDQRLYDIEVIAQACGYTFMEGEDEQASLVMHINRCSSADVYRSTLILMMQVDRPVPNDSVPTMLNVMVTKLNLDTKAITKAATAEAKAVYADKIKAAQAQLAEMKSGKPVAPKAQSDIQLSPRAIKAVKPRASKVRLSADEALSSIAAAMQVQEEAAGDDNAAPVSEQREDAMYQEAVRLVRKEGKPSISLVQRHMKIGYNQAARLLEHMEAEGLITAMGSDGSRSIVEQAAAVEGQQDEQSEPVPTNIAAVTAKYRAVNGETWSGRGLKPKWVTAYIDQGGALENLLVPQEPLSTDPIYAQALALITVEQKASKRLFKEKLRIGQAKALQLLDELEQHGKVSAIDATGGRKVLVAA